MIFEVSGSERYAFFHDVLDNCVKFVRQIAWRCLGGFKIVLWSGNRKESIILSAIACPVRVGIVRCSCEERMWSWESL